MATLLFRTDLRIKRQDLAAAVRRPSEDGFLPNLSIIEDQKLEGCTPDTLIKTLSGNHTIIFVADSTTMTHQDRPILCVDAAVSPSRRLQGSVGDLPHHDARIGLLFYYEQRFLRASKNAKIEYRWAEHTTDCRRWAADLVRQKVAVIAAVATPAVRTAKSCDIDDSNRVRHSSTI